MVRGLTTKQYIECVLGYLLFVFIIPLLAGIVANDFSLSYELSSWVQLALIIIIAGLWWTLRAEHPSKNLFQKPTLPQWHLWFGTLGLLGVVAFLGRLIWPSFDSWFVQRASLYSWQAVVALGVMLIALAFKEEIIERLFIQRNLEIFPGWVVVAVVSINFALAHLFVSQRTDLVFAQVISVAVGSIVLVAFYLVTQNFWLAGLLHLVYNVCNVIQIHLHITYPQWEWLYWVAFAVLLIATARKTAIKLYQGVSSHKGIELNVSSKLFLSFFAVVLPLVMFWLMSK